MPARRVAIILCLLLASVANAQEPTPLARVEALGLDTMRMGHVTTYFARPDRERAEQITTLLQDAAAYFERDLGVSFDLRVAALGPARWISDIPDIPDTIPWAAEEERLIIAPAFERERPDLPSPRSFDRAIEFIALHEYGHLAANEYLHPGRPGAYRAVRWFKELLATYFAYAFVRSVDPEWADSAKSGWAGVVASYTPRELSLDWSFMRGLPPAEVGQTYGWYQNLLNLRVAEVFEQHGVGFLRAVRDRLAWDEMDTWTTASLLPRLEEIAPGFQAWADRLERRTGSAPEGRRGLSPWLRALAIR